MSNFKYIEKNNKLYLSIGNGRILIPWFKRWVPSWYTIETEPVIEDNTFEVSSIDEIEDSTLILNSGDIKDSTVILD